MPKPNNRPWFEIRVVSKSFGGVKALSGISLDLVPGEVHGLVGENGAGKSTLINIATGVYQPDSGSILIDGREVHFQSPRQATQAGIAVVHQEAELFADLSLAENMLMGVGLPTYGMGWVNWSQTHAIANQALSEMEEDFQVESRARDLSIAQRVLAQIASAVHQNARVLFLDEPTASLTHKETRILFRQIERLKARGVAIVYVSHRLEEVLELCDRITVLRDGQHVWTRPANTVSLDEMVQAMVGRTVHQYYPEKKSAIGKNLLSVENLSDREGQFRNISLTLREGEILGLYGLVGAGRSEVAQALFGIRKIVQGQVKLSETPFELKNPERSLSQGLAYLPEDRLNQGIFRGLSVRVNGVVSILRRISSLTFVSKSKETDATNRILTQMQVKTDGPEVPIENLSGGNQQKVVLGRWLETQPKVLLLDEPTRGVDVGAKAEIHRLIADLAAQGKGVILISSELPEVLAMSDRVLVMCEGEIAGEFDPRVDSPDQIATAAFPFGGKPESTDTDRSESNAGSRINLRLFREAGIGLALLLLVVILGFLRPESFLSLSNLGDVLSSISILTVAALGATFVIGVGGIDISVGSMLGLVGAATGMAAVAGTPVLFCLLLAILLGAFLGFLNMGASTLGRVHPIIVTLAGLSIYRGLMRQLTGGYEVTGLPESYRALGDGFLLEIPRVVWFAGMVLVVAWILLERTVFGRQLLAVGNSKTAAAQIGLPAARLAWMAFALNGAFIGLASVLWGAYYGKLQTSAGEGLELQAIAAAVIGGCNIMGGSGTAIGTFLGACLIGVLNNGLILLQVSSYWQPVFIGILILVIVILDGWVTRSGRRQKR